ncbi:MAG: hypothetical protein K0S46_1102 [Moraxellaceae bacterium]|jgi:uncharacterized membrane protein|nr:hypothetical protein [Moraxellaceae bacterium]
MKSFADMVEVISLVIDAAGVFAILFGLAAALLRLRLPLPPGLSTYRRFRQDLGRGILLGLELLLAADIIRTVALTPTLQDVLSLAVIVLIRTFLSFTLAVELEGRWPWQRRQEAVREEA